MSGKAKGQPMAESDVRILLRSGLDFDRERRTLRKSEGDRAMILFRNSRMLLAGAGVVLAVAGAMAALSNLRGNHSRSALLNASATATPTPCDLNITRPTPAPPPQPWITSEEAWEEQYYTELIASPSFGGRYLDSAGNRFTNVVGDPCPLLQLAAMYGIEDYANVTFVPVRYPLAELEALKDRIGADRERWLALGIEINMVDADDVGNLTVVGIGHPTPIKELLLMLAYGRRITVVEAYPAIALMAIR